MSSCGQFDPLIAERAAGDLAPDDDARLDAHLAGCERCRAELAAYQQALGLARLPAVTEAERQPLSHLATRVRADVERPALGKVLGRLLGLAAVAAAIVVVIANRLVLPGAEQRATDQAAIAANWQEPDPAALFERVEREHPELAIGTANDLSRAEQLADAAYLKAIAEE